MRTSPNTVSIPLLHIVYESAKACKSGTIAVKKTSLPLECRVKFLDRVFLG